MNAASHDYADGPRRFLNKQDDHWVVQIMQGDFYVTGDPKETLTTILGSCIAVCIRDPIAGIGGMNHFLLPGEDTRAHDRDAERYGDYLMELLINGLMKQGAQRERLEAKLFGGANVIAAMSDIGARNAEFARQFLEDEGIAYAGGDVGGNAPRRIQFWPVSGRARQIFVRVDRKTLGERERIAATAAPVADDDVELF